MGSGHILVYAFDVLMQIYEAQGYTQRDAARLIVENNLYGLEIDKRAYQISYFALMMKGRQYDRRFFDRGVQPQVYCPDGYRDGELFGSLLMVDKLEPMPQQGELNFFSENYETQLNRWNFRRLLAQKYDVVCTNPPYMATSNLVPDISDTIKKEFSDEKADLFACYIDRCRKLTLDNGFQAMITQHAWMFLSSYEKAREKIRYSDTVNMLHLGARAFEEIGGEVVQTSSFVLRKTHIKNYKGTYCRLIEPTSQQGKEDMFLAGENRYTAQQDNFSKIPGCPVAYWVSEAMLQIFSNGVRVDRLSEPRKGLTTADDETYLRLWHEVNFLDTTLKKENDNDIKFSVKWVPLNKGGVYRRWYGNNEFLINWEFNGETIRKYKNAVIRNEDYYFRESITWNDITSNYISFRYKESGQIFNDAGPSIFSSKETLFILLAYGNSKIVQEICYLIAPTIHYTVGQISSIPILTNIKQLEKKEILRMTISSISLSKDDWNSYETSWDFKRHPLI